MPPPTTPPGDPVKTDPFDIALAIVTLVLLAVAIAVIFAVAI